jgi:hypothetical protein
LAEKQHEPPQAVELVRDLIVDNDLIELWIDVCQYVAVIGDVPLNSCFFLVELSQKAIPNFNHNV